MKIAGLNFTKISVEKFNTKSEELKVSTNIDIQDILELKSDIIRTKDELLAVKFSYIINYEPNVAKIEIQGTLIVTLEQKLSREVLKEWKDKEKKIPDDFRIPLFNIILKKSSVKVLDLEDEMNLPLHFPFPTFRKEGNQ